MPNAIAHGRGAWYSFASFGAVKATFGRCPMLTFPAWRLGFPVLAPAAACVAAGLVLLLFQPGPNPWLGVRLRWTFADAEVWKTTQCVAAWLLLATGAGLAVWFPAGIVACIAASVVPVVQAYAMYRGKYGTTQTWRGGRSRIDFRPVARCSNCGTLNRLVCADDLFLIRCETCRHPLAE
ncbi:MAG: SdpI family protein [Armatimonadetes bacterium]|nr:SdpI family protein [Armatimonadota bacterium]